MKGMSKKTSHPVLLFTLFFLFLPVYPLNGAQVLLKDGSIIKCKILKDEASFILIQKEDKTKKKIPLDKILRILYTHLYMGKQYIQKVDGTVFEAYMVNSDQKNYTFRSNLLKPDEFTIKREDVLFMTRSNPSCLLARASRDRVRLTWLSPYIDAKSFKIYMKTKNENKYRFVDETASREYTVKKLKINHRYSFIVTAIDEKGDESLPSNEVKAITGKLPSPPGGLSMNSEERDNGKELKVRLKWNKSNDAMIKKYRVYAMTGRGIMKYGETADDQLTINRLSPGMVYHFFVTSVDKNGNESEDSRWVRTGFPVVIHYRFGYTGLLGEMRNYSYQGFNNFLSCYTTDLFFDSMDFGLEIGMTYLKGKLNPMQDIYLYPVYIIFQYSFDISRSISLMPKIAGGYCYKKISYNKEWPLSTYPENSYFKNGYSPVMQLGLTFFWNFWQMIHFQLSAEYNPVFQGHMVAHLFNISVGYGVNF